MDTLIRLACGTFTIIDDIWYDELAGKRWRLDLHGYVSDRHGRKMHRLVMRAKNNQIVDHINRNKLDNRKANLRFVTTQQNAWNRKQKKSASRFTGVFPSGYLNRPWYAEIRIDGKQHWLGSYETQEQAAYVYDCVAKAVRGKFAFLNGVEKPHGLTFAQPRIARRVEALLGGPLS